MAGLIDQFVKHYQAVDAASPLRCHYCDSWNGINRANEVNAIREYITGKGHGLSYLNATVAPRLSSGLFDVKFAGVFCHKKPIVQRTASAKAANPSKPLGCELGDLLVAFVLLDRDDQLHYYASSLFQAKAKEHLDNKTQRLLYDIDASFILPKSLGGYGRDFPIRAAQRARALRYLLMGPRRNDHDIGARRSPWPSGSSVRWGDFAHRLMQAREGLVATPQATGAPWDVINHDLLLMASNVPGNKSPRGSNVAIQLATKNFNSFASREIWHATSEEDPGVPTILMIGAAKERFYLSEQPRSDGCKPPSGCPPPPTLLTTPGIIDCDLRHEG